MIFLKLPFVLFTSKVQIIYENTIIIIIFIFSKTSFLLFHPHLFQVLTILSLPSIHQQPWTTHLKLLMHLKIDFDSFYLISYELKTTFLSLFFYIHPKNPRFWFKNFKVHRTIQAHDLWSLTSRLLWWWSIVWLEKLNKLSHWLKLWNQFFFQICPSEDFRISFFRREDLHGSLLVNAYVSFAIDFMCVF